MNIQVSLKSIRTFQERADEAAKQAADARRELYIHCTCTRDPKTGTYPCNVENAIKLLERIIPEVFVSGLDEKAQFTQMAGILKMLDPNYTLPISRVAFDQVWSRGLYA